MSWLNNSLNTIKGQLSTLAHEIMEETAGPGDAEYHGPPIDNRTAVEMLADTQRDKEDLDKLCSEKETEVSDEVQGQGAVPNIEEEVLRTVCVDVFVCCKMYT